MQKSREEVINYINDLKDYEGYVQFSHRPIDLKKDIFPRSENIDENDTKDGFIYEAHFYNGKDSITIRQVNGHWLVSSTHFSEIYDKKNDIKSYNSIAGKIKMAQIWKAQPDNLCKDMEVMKLQKVVFVGFEKGESK